jgi:hypothetical protein
MVRRRWIDLRTIALERSVGSVAIEGVFALIEEKLAKSLRAVYSRCLSPHRRRTSGRLALGRMYFGSVRGHGEAIAKRQFE